MPKAIVFDCLGVLVDAEGLLNQDLLSYARSELKPKYRLGILSNLNRSSLERLIPPEDILLFDAIGLSSETRVPKPDPRAYQGIAKELGVLPNECIFVDDQEGHCVAARHEGMHTIRYESFEQLSSLLRQREVTP